MHKVWRRAKIHSLLASWACRTYLNARGFYSSSAMVKSFSTHNRILLPILRASPNLRLSGLYSYDHIFLRSFVCSANVSNGFRAVTFGAEADAAIAPYLNKLKGGKVKQSKGERKWSRIEHNPSTVKRYPKGDGHEQHEKNKITQLDAERQHIPQKWSASSEERIVLSAEKDQKSVNAETRRKASKVEDSTKAEKSVTIDLIQATNPKKDQKETKAVRNLAGRLQQHHTPREQWQIQKDALKKKFDGEAWNPRKKLSPDAMEGIRSLHAQDPERFSTPALSQAFKMSPEAIRRILKSKWKPSDEKLEERRERWAKRHDKIWDQLVELGLRPERKKAKQAEGPEEFEELLNKKESLGQI